ncbi:MAG: hypothetical protein JNL14_02490, partial [Devosia sp.]|uniref:hypothetical protein n=1 Tax=Devosia sp. TaxID=1871048 RepID=UPI001A641BA8
MRLVVLLCGVFAGIVGLGFAWWGEPAALVDIYRLPTPQFAAAVIAIHAISANSIAGGLLVLGSPRLGGMMMLASATVWLLIVALIGGGLSVSMAALIGIGGAGGVLAFLPSLGRAAYRLAPVHEDEPRAIGSDRPDIEAQMRPRAVEDAKPQEPAEPASYNWRSSVYDTMEGQAKPEGPAQWVFEMPDAPPAEPDVDVEPPPPPPPPQPPPRPRRPAPKPVEPQPWLSHEDRDEHRPAYEIHHGRIRPLTLKGPRRKRPARGRRIAGIVALTALIVGLPTLLVMDHQVRSSADAASSSIVTADMNAAAGGRSAGEAREIPESAPSEVRLAAGSLPAFDEAAETSAEPAVSSAPLPTQTIAAPAQVAKYGSPFDYCAREKNVDSPDLTLVAEDLPSELVEGMREV